MSGMTPITITYRIKLDKKHTEVFDFTLDGESGNLIAETPANLPPWTALDYKQCSHCPLNKTEHSHCPIAVQLYNIIERFHNTSSIDEIELEVITEERKISQVVPLQRAIGSMLGLVSPTCGCPKMAYMKPMARFHLPLSSEEETLFRVAGMYLLAQYVLGKAEGSSAVEKAVADFSGLKAIYEDLHILNKALATRLRGATESDSSKNAIALLDMYSNLVPMMIDDHLPDLQDLFSAYSSRGNRSVAPTDDNKEPVVELAPVVPTITLPLVAPSVVTAQAIVAPDIVVPEIIVPELTLEPITKIEEPVQEVVTPVVKKVKEKTADELAVEALMQDVSADELAELLGTQQDVVIKKNMESQDRPKGRAVFQIAVEPEPLPDADKENEIKTEPASAPEKPKGRAVFKLADD